MILTLDDAAKRLDPTGRVIPSGRALRRQMRF